MPRFARAALLFAMATATLSTTGAQTLSIGIEEDPDLLDPAQGASFVGRIVFAAVCDKLLDVDTSLNFVPQLATEWVWEPRQQGADVEAQVRREVP